MNNQTTYTTPGSLRRKEPGPAGNCGLCDVHFERDRRDLAICTAAVVIGSDQGNIEPARCPQGNTRSRA
jgi:hypothetical protein